MINSSNVYNKVKEFLSCEKQLTRIFDVSIGL